VPTEIVIPKLGMTMKEGTIVEWTVADGARVEPDEVVFRMTTDKLDTEITAEAPGTLRHAAGAGETHPTGAVVGWILADGEALPVGAGTGGSAPAGGSAPPTTGGPSGAPAVNGGAVVPGRSGAVVRDGRVIATPYARRRAREQGIDLLAVTGTGPRGRIVAADVARAVVAGAGRPGAAAPLPSPAEDHRVMATTGARSLAERLGVDLRLVSPAQPGGWITKEDVEGVARRAAPAGPAGAAAPPGPARPAAPAGPPAGSRVPLTGMRRVIAERMHASLHEMAQLTLGMDVDMTDAARLRRQLVDEWAAEGVKVTYTDLVGRAAIKALAQHPGLNASVESDAVALHVGVNLGFAVAVPAGLLVPVIPAADQLGLRDLSAEAARLAGSCRDGTIGFDRLEGATFTVTALGANGIDFFTPVINPPNVAILGIGRVHDGVGWEGERPVRRQVMTLSLTIDHRAVDGAPGAAFLGTVRDLLEAPYRLLA